MIRKFKRLVISITYIAIAATAGYCEAADSASKIDPFFDAFRPSGEVVSGGHFTNIKASASDSETAGVSTVSAFVKTTDTELTRDAIERAGGSVLIEVGDILSAEIPADELGEISGADEVVFIEAAKPIDMKNDVASAEINVPYVHSGHNLPEGYTGEDVVVGIIDTGIDLAHDDFLDADGRSRVLAVWNQKGSSGPSPSEISNGYGTECAYDSIAAGSCRLTDTDGHGTHVAGIAAGRDDVYGGIAPDAKIIVVGYDSSIDVGSGYAETLFSTKICEAAYYVFAKAESLGLPAVVNLSLGTHIGPHDGTSLFEQCLSGLVKNSSGRAIVAAAGNERNAEFSYTGIHTGFELSGEAVASNFEIRQLTEDKIYYIDIWGDVGSDLDFGLAVHDGKPSAEPSDFTGLKSEGRRYSGKLYGGKIEYIINSTETSSPLNGKPHVGIRITIGNSVADISKLSFDLVVSGSGGFDAWLFPDKPSGTVQFTSFSGDIGGDWSYEAGSRTNNIAIPATSPDIITVTAFTSRNEWDGGNGCCVVNYELGDLLEFSSVGPTSDPDFTGVKPDIAAPGAMIASALSSHSHPNELMITGDRKHAMQAGTSMAAPFVSGTIALMFDADPNFTQEDVKRFIIEGAYSDVDTGAVPNDMWGHGKLDSLSTVSHAIARGASGSFDANSPLETPSTSVSYGSVDGGCALNPQANAPRERAVPIFFAFVSLVLVISYKRLRRNPARTE